MHEQIQARRTFRKASFWIGGGLCLLLGTAAIALRGRPVVSPSDRERSSAVLPVSRLELPQRAGMIRIPAGSFLMGSPAADTADAQGQHEVALDAFWLDQHPLTNAQFAEFVAATGYKTTAERRGESLVFDIDKRAWQTTRGADWRRPHGSNSSIAAREDWPVVQVSWFDAVAYCRWAGKRLPTEAEYEYAARGGLADCDYPWGRELFADDQQWANAWQGRFPHFDLRRDGYAGTSPVGAFPPNRYGLVDIAGNVYSWCADWYDAVYYDRSPRENPRGPQSGRQRVQRGGSWLSADNHEPLAAWRRRAAEPMESSNHIGFRCASDAPPSADPLPHLARQPGGTRE